VLENTIKFEFEFGVNDASFPIYISLEEGEEEEEEEEEEEDWRPVKVEEIDNGNEDPVEARKVCGVSPFNIEGRKEWETDVEEEVLGVRDMNTRSDTGVPFEKKIV